MKWTAANDQLLLLRIIEVHNFKIDGKKVVEGWPVEEGESAPTERAIRERLFTIRNKAKKEGKAVSCSTTNGGSGGGSSRSANGVNASVARKTISATRRKRTGKNGLEAADDSEAVKTNEGGENIMVNDGVKLEMDEDGNPLRHRSNCSPGTDIHTTNCAPDELSTPSKQCGTDNIINGLPTPSTTGKGSLRRSSIASSKINNRKRKRVTFSDEEPELMGSSSDSSEADSLFDFHGQVGTAATTGKRVTRGRRVATYQVAGVEDDEPHVAAAVAAAAENDSDESVYDPVAEYEKEQKRAGKATKTRASRREQREEKEISSPDSV